VRFPYVNMFLNPRSTIELDELMINPEFSETSFEGSPIMLCQNQSSSGHLVVPVEDTLVHAVRAFLILTEMSVNRTTF